MFYVRRSCEKNRHKTLVNLSLFLGLELQRKVTIKWDLGGTCDGLSST